MKIREWQFINYFLSKRAPREVALEWAPYWGHNPVRALVWLKAGVSDPWRARKFEELGLDPFFVEQWIEKYEGYGMDNLSAQTWLFFFYDSPELVEKLYREGWRKPYRAHAAVRKYGADKLEEILSPYTELGLSREEAFELLEHNKASPDIFQLCRHFKMARLILRAEKASPEEREVLKEKVERYTSLGLSRESAEELVLYEQLEEVSDEWIEVGIREVELIRSWKEWTPEKAKEWIDAGVWTPSRAKLWMELGMVSGEAKRWVEVGVDNPLVAKRLKEEGIAPEQFPLLCRNFRLTAPELVDWLTQMNLREIRGWLRAGINYHELAVELSLMGWTSEEIKRLSKSYGLEKVLHLAMEHTDKESVMRILEQDNSKSLLRKKINRR